MEKDWRTVHPLGVLYVASREVDAFSTDDDFLLLRMMGKLISEQVMTYQMHTLLVNEFPEMVAHPRVIDSTFQEFYPDYQFIRQLEKLLEQIRPAHNADSLPANESQPFHHLTFIAVNLSIPGNKVDTRALNTATRSLTIELGKRIQRWARGKSESIEVYYMYNECYYLLLRDISLEQTAHYAFDLQDYLHGYIQRHAQQHGFKSAQVAGIQLHLGVVGYTYDKLQDLQARMPPGASLRVKITNLLNNALSNSKDRGENIIAIWQPQDERFVESVDGLIDDKSLQLQNAQFIEQIANTAIARLKDELPLEQITNAVIERLKNGNSLHPDINF